MTKRKANLLSYSRIIASLPFLLTGCMGVYEGGFECPPVKGLGCTSISDVNHLVNQKVVPKDIHIQESDLPKEDKVYPRIWFNPHKGCERCSFPKKQKENSESQVIDAKDSI